MYVCTYEYELVESEILTTNNSDDCKVLLGFWDPAIQKYYVSLWYKYYVESRTVIRGYGNWNQFTSEKFRIAKLMSNS